MLNNWANNPPKQEHAVEDICNSTTVINGNTCYTNPAKILYYHSAFVCRLEPQPLARLWLPVCACVCVGGFTLLSWPAPNVFTQHVLRRSFTFSRLSFLRHTISAVPPPLLLLLIPQPPGEGPTMGTADLPFTPPSNWITHCSIKSPSLKGPSTD